MRLKPNKCTGLDKIPAKIFRLSADIITPSLTLTYILNLSLDTAICVDEWKREQVSQSKNVKIDVNAKTIDQSRPISILPIVSKLFEKEVFRQLYGYPSNNFLLSQFQLGFRPIKNSTLSAMIGICNDLLTNTDDGKLNCVIFLAIKQAFDFTNHEILFKKMSNFFGKTGIQLKWFELYLNNRVQQYLVDG